MSCGIRASVAELFFEGKGVTKTYRSDEIEVQRPGRAIGPRACRRCYKGFQEVDVAYVSEAQAPDRTVHITGGNSYRAASPLPISIGGLLCRRANRFTALR